GKNDWHSYPPLSVGVSPNRVHSPTDMSRELRTVTTAARARPHFDFTMSILPEQPWHTNTRAHKGATGTSLDLWHILKIKWCEERTKKERKKESKQVGKKGRAE
uniref:Uncharacterized protein n=1 Tax=Dicentrarchus labrax TaxID=13489 RepID=A0A8C4D8N6_DICLA